MTDFIKTSTDGRVMTILFNRPDQLNAITQAMYDAIAEGLDQAAADPAIRAVVLRGEGRAFTAGNDLKDFATAEMAATAPVVRFLDTIREFPKPLIACVNGLAIGVGLTMLLHCDLVFAAEEASFRAPFAHLGLVPEAGSSMLLPRSVGMALANDILIAGRTLSAQEALDVGLVSRVYPLGSLLEETMAVAGDVASQAPEAMRHSKALIRAGKDVLAKHMHDELVLFGQQLQSHEFREAATAMMQKRTPNFP